MSHWIVLPILLPAVTAPFLVLALRHHLRRQRIASLGATLLLLGVAVRLYLLAGDAPPQPYLLGDWPAPFGIVLVLDRLSATMLLLTAVLALAVAIYAAAGWDERGRHFHPLFQFQLMGINGAFLTGDLFNLFVFFEVMLIASYGLMLHGSGPERLRAGLHYVAINLIGSTLFLFAVGTIYGVTGTLNMADLAVQVARIPPENAALLRTGALLLLIVFALKAALVPLHWWLPTAYAAAPAPAAALFMVLTKVGAYSILRVYTLIFGADAGAAAGIAAPWLIPGAILTLIVGAAGVLASRSVIALVCFAVVWSMGSLLVTIGLFDADGITAGLYYLLHSTLAGAALFLLADLLPRSRGSSHKASSPPMRPAGTMAAMFLVAAIAMAGMPPLSGFLGKLFILNASSDSSAGPWIWTTIIATSLAVILGFARVGGDLFWKAQESVPPAAERPALVPLSVCAVLLGGTAALAIFAGPVTSELAATAGQVLDTGAYIRAVLPQAAAALGDDAMAGRLFPHPILTGLLAALWLALVNQVSAGHVLLGILVGIAVPLFISIYWPDRVVLKKPARVLEYIAVVVRDIVVSNVEVAYLVLFRRGESLRSQFVTVPLDLQSPEAITVLAGTITMTPGTVSADLAADGSAILVHCLETTDPDGVVRQIKDRYERRLREIFE